MVRRSLECTNCHGKNFEVTYGSGSCDGSWQVELVCQDCGCLTLIAVTDDYVPRLECVNERRDFYNPKTKLKGENEDGRDSNKTALP